MGSHGSKTLESLDASQPFTVYQYYPNGSLQSVETLDQTIGYTYDAIGREKSITRVGASLTAIDSRIYNDAARTMTRTLPNGDDLEYGLDGFGRILTETISINNNDLVKSWTYTPSGQVASQIDREARTIEYDYDRLGRQVTESWIGGFTGGQVSQTRYYADGRILSGSNPVANFDFTYDAVGNLDTTTQTNALLGSQVIVLDYNTNLVTRTHQLDTRVDGDFVASTIRQFDAFGRTGSIRESSADGTFAAKSLQYTYVGGFSDEIYRYNSATLPTSGHSGYVSKTSIVQRGDYLPTSITHEHVDGGASAQTAQHTVTYDALGRILGHDVGTDDERIRTRDSFSRVRTVSDNAGALDELFTYDINGTRVSDDEGYDRVLFDGGSRYTYDNDGNVTREIEFLPTVSPVLSLDNGGIITPYLQTNDSSDYFTLPAGWYRIQVPPIVMENDPSSGSGDLEPSSITVTVELRDGFLGAAKIESKTFTLEGLGNDLFTTGESLVLEDSLSAGISDAWIKLTISLNGNYQRHFTTDVRVDVEHADRIIDYEYDHHNRVVQTTTYSASTTSPAGVVPNLPLETLDYTYDHFGNLASYTITPNGGSSYSRYFVYEGDEVLLEFDSLQRLERKRLYGEGRLLAVDDIDFEVNASHPRETIWVLHDTLGSVRDLFVAADRTESLKYDEFGRPGHSVNLVSEVKLWDAVGEGFLGMEWNPNLGSYADNGRLYDPLAGRYTSVTDVGWLGGQSNLYLFANNSPADRQMGSRGAGRSSTTYAENFSQVIGYDTFSARGHLMLDGVGLIPGAGILADVANAAWYAAEGDYIQAGFSLGAAIPGAGYAFNAAKYAGKASKLYTASRAADIALNFGQSTYYAAQGIQNQNGLQVGLSVLGLGINTTAVARMGGVGAKGLNSVQARASRAFRDLGSGTRSTNQSVTRLDDFVDYIAGSNDLSPAVRQALNLVDGDDVSILLQKLDRRTLAEVFFTNDGVVKGITVNSRLHLLDKSEGLGTVS